MTSCFEARNLKRASRSHAKTGLSSELIWASEWRFRSRRPLKVASWTQKCRKMRVFVIFKASRASEMAFSLETSSKNGFLAPSSGQLGHLRATWAHLGAILGLSWAILGDVGPILARPGAILGGFGASCGLLKPFSDSVGLSCGPLGTSWGSSWGHLGPSGAILGHLGAIFGHRGLILSSSWAIVGPSWAILAVLWVFKNSDFAWDIIGKRKDGDVSSTS